MLLAAQPSFGAELSVEFSAVARSGVTSIPNGSGSFTGFGNLPAVDADGNVVFTGTGNNDSSGNFQSGVYTAIGVCCQRVADRKTAIPGGGGTTFYVFSGSEGNDIDNGRVAFTARLSASSLTTGLYSNVGQSSPGTLREVALVDGYEWSSKGDPYIDGGKVSMRGYRLLSTNATTILLWNGATGAKQYMAAGDGYIVTAKTQAPVSGNAVAFRRYTSNSSEMGVSVSGNYEPLAVLGVTSVPGLNGSKFKFFRDYPIVDQNGLDAAFIGSDGTVQGLFKRTGGGPLENVADTSTVMPGTTAIPGMGEQLFNLFPEQGLAIVDGYVAFQGLGPNSLDGIYTDIGGTLSVVVDTDENSTIVVDGQTKQVTDLNMGPKSFAYTPDGYTVVFKAWFSTGETAIIRAVVEGSGPGGSTSGSFTVYKDFSDNNTAWVSISLSCTSGTVTNSPQWAREGTPAVFTISSAASGATCTAVENSVPSGYTKNESGCQNLPTNGSCTIFNTLNPTTDSFTVYKDFSDNNTAWVDISLSCTSGTVTNSPQWAREGTPAVFTISSATSGATCTAVENSVPSGYTKNESGCQNKPLDGSCTIVNTKTTSSTDQFTVRIDFSDDNSLWVMFYLSCSSGTVTNNPRWGRQGTPAVFEISGASAGTTCTATQSQVPEGYTKDDSDCQDGDPINGSCTILNTLGQQVSSDRFTVYKDFSDNNAASVSVSLSCTSGTVTNSPQWAAEGSPAIFEIEGAAAGATCTATENVVPAGYTKNESGCQDGDPVNGSCTIFNTLNPTTHSFTVYKDFSDNNAASVSVRLSCTSGTVTNSPRLASEGSPAVFNISGALAGTTCTAVESVVPSGYTANQSDCQNGDPLNGSCTIINTLIVTDPDDIITNSSFETGQAEGWSLNEGAKIDSKVALGQYSLLLENDGATSQRAVSTAGYSDVSVTMHLAGGSLEKNDVCYAELSTNGGSTWTPVLKLGSDTAGVFVAGTASPAAASNNTNLRLRIRLTGKGKGDYCWGDDITVRGTPSGGTTAGAKADGGTVQVVISESTEFTADSGVAAMGAPYGSRGFDPGFDQLTGDGNVDRRDLSYEMLMNGLAPSSPARFAFTVPGGAAQPEYLFEGTLELRDLNGSSASALPGFSVEFVQVGNHLFPVAHSGASEVYPQRDWDYVVDTGKVWNEVGDHGFSRAAIPFFVADRETGCTQDGVVTFLFRGDGTTSGAVYQMFGNPCGLNSIARSGALAAVYSPASVGNQAPGIESVTACAAETWLPQVQGRGGITLVLMPDDRTRFVLTDSTGDLWLDTGEESAALSGLCE